MKLLILIVIFMTISCNKESNNKSEVRSNQSGSNTTLPENRSDTTLNIVEIIEESYTFTYHKIFNGELDNLNIDNAYSLFSNSRILPNVQIYGSRLSMLFKNHRSELSNIYALSESKESLLDIIKNVSTDELIGNSVENINLDTIYAVKHEVNGKKAISIFTFHEPSNPLLDSQDSTMDGQWYVSEYFYVDIVTKIITLR